MSLFEGWMCLFQIFDDSINHDIVALFRCATLNNRRLSYCEHFLTEMLNN
jgi:hypothetical protein